MMVGAPGTGKSTLGRRLARAIGAEVVQTDQVRKLLFPEPHYTNGEHAAVYGWCHNLLRTILAEGGRAVFDATNLEERHRRRVYEMAEEMGARLLVVWASAPPSEVQRRLLRRREEPSEDDYSDAGWPVYLEMRRHADPVRRPHLVVNTGTDLDLLTSRVVSRLS
jgi:predicted kinase